MKLNHIKYILLVAMVGLFSQCTKLDEQPYTFISPGQYYKSADDLNAALNGVYYEYQREFGDNYKYYMQLECLSEFGAPNRTKDNPHLYNVWYDVNNPDMSVNVWSGSYQIINDANVVLGRGKSINMSDTLKNRMFGEARFLRALTYFNLLRLYGGVPIPSSYTNGLDSLDIPRKTADETYDYIISDLQYAMNNLPLKSTYGSDDNWRATKGAAEALLGKVYLYRASMESKDEYYQESEKYSKMVMDSKQYQLEPDFRDLWKWWNPDNAHGMESIFEINFANIKHESNHLHINGGINVSDPVLGSYMYHRFGPSFTAYNSYSDSDYRKSSTFLTKVTLSTGTTIQWVEADSGYYPGSKGWVSACPGDIKYFDRTNESYTTGEPAADIYVLRYAGVLLNYAEAENKVNGPTQAAYDAINLVRNRAHLPNLTAGLTQAQFDDSVYRERGWEFIGEGELYYDGIRTGKIGPAVKAEIQYGVDHNLYLYTPLQFVPKKTFLWKIPTYDLNSNPALVQNPDNVSG